MADDYIPHDDQPQRDLSPLGLYSHAAEMASQLPQERGSPQQMAGMLVNKYGVKPVEMEGFDETFAGQPTVTRDQLVQHFKSKMPQIEEKVLGVQPQGVPYSEEYQKIEQSIIDKYSPEMARHHAIYNDRSNDQSVRNEALQNVENLRDQMWSEIDQAIPNREELLAKAKPEITPTKFQQYTLPGGENYREVLLKLPRLGLTTGDVAQKLFGRNMDQLSPAEGRAVSDEMRRLGPYSQNDFIGGHWVEPNVLAHLRMSDRSGPKGEKILHIEEIQSDWAQKGRDEGFAKKLDLKILDQLGEEQSSAMFRLEDARKAFNDAYENIFKENLKSAFKDAPTEYDLQNAMKMHDEVIKSNHPQKKFDEYRSNFLRMPDSFTPEQHSLLQDAYDAYREKRDSYNSTKEKMLEYRLSSNGVAAGPYITKTADWTDLALKRALKEAVDGGYDKLVWTPGEEQAKRYSLSTKVERIAYDPEEKVFSYVPKGRHDWVDHDNTVEPKDLPGIVGKEVAEKLLATEPNKLSGIHNLEAADLEVGGHGMKGYYDKIVPTQLQKLLKKLDPDAKVGSDSVVVRGTKNSIRQDDLARELGVSVEDIRAMSNEQRKQAVQSVYGVRLPALTITPKMREAIKRGLPAFASGGAVDEDEDEGITAYHGSPYDFPKFDTSKIGSGEGAQAYGHGLYFAEQEPVAREYRDKLSKGTYETDTGKVLDAYNDLEHLNIRVAAYKSLDNAIERAQGLLETQPERADVINRDLAKLLEAKTENAAPRKGHMYEVHIKTHPDHFLDWDKSLNHDDNAYAGDLLPGVRHYDTVMRRFNQTPTGEQFYEELALFSGSHERASKLLANAGIAGIKYLDAGSRGPTEKPTRNYVVFNHDHVDIKRKYARGGAVDVG